MQASPLPPTCLHSTPLLWPFKQSLSQSIYKSVTPSAQQLPQPRAGNAIRGSACPAGSALQLSGWSGQLPIFLFILSDPSAVSRVTILHLSSCKDNLQYMCVILEVYCFFFYPTLMTQLRLHSKWWDNPRETVHIPFLFLKRVSKWTNLKADMPKTPLCPIVRQVGEPVLHLCLSLKTVLRTVHHICWCLVC